MGIVSKDVIDVRLLENDGPNFGNPYRVLRRANKMADAGKGNEAGSQKEESSTEDKTMPVPTEAAEAQSENADQGAVGGAVGDEAGFAQSFMEHFKQYLNIKDEEKPEQLLEEVTFEGVVKYVKSEKCKKIITMAGAGISTSAGIPDFRSPGCGLYDSLQNYNLSSPTDIFSITFFMENPEPFFVLAKELFPVCLKPTPCHYFLKMLSDKGLLLRHYTQNIDTLERIAGIPPDQIVEAHGSFSQSHCIKCDTMYTLEWTKERVMKGEIPKCTAESCGGTVKPDIVFFGEKLPSRFFECLAKDFDECDLLIVLGTSLVVEPFASLTRRVPKTSPRLYINREKTTLEDNPFAMFYGGGGFEFDSEDNYRDVFWQGDCDAGSYAMADELGWGDELRKMVTQEQAKIDGASASAKI